MKGYNSVQGKKKLVRNSGEFKITEGNESKVGQNQRKEILFQNNGFN